MRPRQHAYELLKIPTLAERRQYLAANVPAEWHEWVKGYLVQWWPKRESIIDTVEKKRDRINSS